VLRPKVSRAYWDDIDVMLTVTEFNIVHCLVTSASEYVTYRSIYDCVHRIGFVGGCGDDGYRTNVRSSIKRIRNKFRAIDAAFSQIENFPAFGYRWRGAPARPA
jgi:two-component system response regulator ChvI